MDHEATALTEELALKAKRIAGDSLTELERCCWIVIHEYHHGFKPSEYDIREIDEELYLSVLNRLRSDT